MAHQLPVALPKFMVDLLAGSPGHGVVFAWPLAIAPPLLHTRRRALAYECQGDEMGMDQCPGMKAGPNGLCPNGSCPFFAYSASQ